MKSTLFYIKNIFLLLIISYVFPFIFLISINESATTTSTSSNGVDSIFILDKWQAFYDLNPCVKVLEEPADTFSLQDVQQASIQNKFQSAHHFYKKTKLHQFYWGKFVINNQLQEADKYTEWVLMLSGSWTELDVYISSLDGTFKHHRNGVFVPNAKKDFVPTTEGNLLKISLYPQENTTVYFRGKGDMANIPPRFWTMLRHSSVFYTSLQQQKIKYALFYGFVLMMFFYNVILFFLARDRSFIYYSIYLLSQLIYFAFDSGDLGDWLEQILFPDYPQYLAFGKLAIYIGLMSYLAFINNFLNLKILLPRWRHIFKGLIVLGIPLLMLDFYLLASSNFSYVKADKITVLYILLSINGCILLIYPLLKTKDKKGYFIITGIFFIGLGVVLTIVARLTSTGFSIFYLQLGTVLEIIIFSLGLAYRQRESERAKQLANFELEKAQLIQAQKNRETEQLKALNTFKNQFYTNITHEFRTPLTVIQGLTSYIKTKKYQKETQLIQRNSQQLLQLVNQMLELSKAESGKMSIQKIQGDVNEYLQYILESFHSLAEQKQVFLTFETQSAIICTDYDPKKLLDISSNLISNAIKFTPIGNNIYLKTKTIQDNHQSYWQLEVQDEGIGIEAKKLPHIFDRFYQADASATRIGEGTGIGLALVQELVKLLDGELSVKSEVGKGTTFQIIFPLTLEAPLTKPPIQKSLLTQTKKNTPFTKTSVHTHIDLPIALLIEDNEDVLHYLVKCLQHDYQIITALNGKEGIAQAIEHVPDIIISDVMMPLVDGYEVCSTLKENEKTSHIPIILLTAKADQGSKITGLKSGADAYIAKPFDRKELEIRLKKLVNLRRTLQQRYQTISNAPVTPNPQFIKEDAFLQKLKSMIEKNMGEEQFSVEGLAKLMLMSRSQLFRKVKALTGKSTSLYIRSIRLFKARHLLDTTSLNISQVAYEVGFKNLTHFTRSFSEEFGQTPSEMRG